MKDSRPNNFDEQTVASFGDEWQRFDQQLMDRTEAQRIFESYFALFPWHLITKDSEGFDMGCGSGRWAQFVAPRVGVLNCIDPSTAISVAKTALKNQPNVVFHSSSVSNCPILPGSQDFGYSLGVLHHVPDTAAAIRSCVNLLKPGAPLLLYLYYSFENRPRWFTWLWNISNLLRLLIHRLPSFHKKVITDTIAIAIYLPLARIALFGEFLGLQVDSFPLSAYRRSSIFTMRTDSRDRFGTPLEQRFSRSEILRMCQDAGLVDITFSPTPPYWCVNGIKR